MNPLPFGRSSRRASLRVALPVLILAVTGLSLVVGRAYSVRAAAGEALRDLSVEAASQGRSLESTIEYLLPLGLDERVQAVLAEWSAGLDAQRGILVDDRRIVIAATRRAWIGKSLDSLEAQLADSGISRLVQAAASSATAPSNDLETFVATYLVTLPPGTGEIRNEQVGRLVLEYDLATAVARARAAIDSRTRYVAALLTLGALVAALALHFLVSRRLWRIEQTIKQRAAGHLDALSGVTGRDEIGQVGEALDTLTTELGTSNALLTESQATLQTFIENAPEAVAILDRDSGRFVEANQNAENLLGRTKAELLRLTPADVSPPNQPDGTRSADLATRYLQAAPVADAAPFDWIHRTAEGVDIPCEVRLIQLPISGRRLVRASITDIRDRKAAQDQLLRAQKLESVGRLAGGVAHDFNNLLSIVLTSTELAQRAVAPDSSAGAKLVDIKEAAHRGAALTRQLLAFAGHQAAEPQPVDINAATRNLSRLLERLIGDDIALPIRLSDESWHVKIDPGQLEQVIINLAVNARDAMPSGGVISIETVNVILETSRHGLPPGDYVRMTVRDTGMGFDDAVKERLFDPFFTTKEKSKGTGLGLATCYGIVAAAHGVIVAESAPGKGAEFTVWLPRTLEPLAKPEPIPKPATQTRPELRRILVVEDERRLRPVIVMALEEEGYEVLAAGDANEALALVSDGKLIDALVTDVVMPGVSGRELAKVLGTKFPDLRVLFTSGYDDDQIQRSGGLAADAAFLQKPYSLSTLVDRVAQLLS